MATGSGSALLEECRALATKALASHFGSERSKAKAVICAAGGAAQGKCLASGHLFALSWLPIKLTVWFLAAGWILGTPEASSCILDVNFPYSRGSLKEYVGSDFIEDESFSSASMAEKLAKHALRHAVRAAAGTEGFEASMKTDLLGIGFAGSLATNRDRKGEDKCFLCVRALDGYEAVHSKRFQRGKSTRVEQDAIASMLVVQGFLEGSGVKTNLEVQIERDFVSEASSVVTRERRANLGMSAQLESWFSKVEKRSHDHLWFWPGSPQLSLWGSDIDLSKQRKLMLSGSFNPLHDGHKQLVEKAQLHCRTRKFQPIFELAVTNVDKGEIVIEDVEQRIKQFAAVGPVVITNASKFVDKARILPNTTFLIGYDTAIRLVDPKYYNNSEEDMNSSLLEMILIGSDFIVAGRFDDQKDEFLTLEEMIDSIPSGLRSAFSGLSESEFRVDLSSSELRKRNAASFM